MGIKPGLPESRWNALSNTSILSSCIFQRLETILWSPPLLVTDAFPVRRGFQCCCHHLRSTRAGCAGGNPLLGNKRTIYPITPFQIPVDAVKVIIWKGDFRLRTLHCESPTLTYLLQVTNRRIRKELLTYSGLLPTPFPTVPFFRWEKWDLKETKNNWYQMTQQLTTELREMNFGLQT